MAQFKWNYPQEQRQRVHMFAHRFRLREGRNPTQAEVDELTATPLKKSYKTAGWTRPLTKQEWNFVYNTKRLRQSAGQHFDKEGFIEAILKGLVKPGAVGRHKRQL